MRSTQGAELRSPMGYLAESMPTQLACRQRRVKQIRHSGGFRRALARAAAGTLPPVLLTFAALRKRTQHCSRIASITMSRAAARRRSDQGRKSRPRPRQQLIQRISLADWLRPLVSIEDSCNAIQSCSRQLSGPSSASSSAPRPPPPSRFSMGLVVSVQHVMHPKLRPI
jgi:hypothetical protein